MNSFEYDTKNSSNQSPFTQTRNGFKSKMSQMSIVDQQPSLGNNRTIDRAAILEEIEQNKINEIRINAKTFQRKYSNAKKYNN